MVYSPIVEAHFFAPQNVYNVEDLSHRQPVVYQNGAVEIGDAIVLYLFCDHQTNRIEKLQYQVYGNPYLIAALSCLSEQAKGWSIQQLASFDFNQLIDTLSIPTTKHYIVYMIEDSIQAVITKWRAQNEH
jgi:NifU-like protein involved in Fe-S cluster formation